MTEQATFGAGCFWGVEWVFRKVPGVLDAVSGYSGGATANPTYRDVCSHTTGHAEVVRVTFDPSVVTYEQLLEVFWAMHDPTQVDRQGPDIGDQYRSVIFTHTPEQLEMAIASRDAFQAELTKAGYGTITTEIREAPEFYFAEDYHQQYLHKNPDGYCGLGGTGVSCPIGLRT